jgi:hypothetical protein
MKQKKILVPVDGFEYCLQALGQAIKMALRTAVFYSRRSFLS